MSTNNNTQNNQAIQYRFVLLMLLIGISVTFFTDMYVPTLPDISLFFGTNANLVQLSITGYLLAVALSQLIYGPLSDRYGRRRILFTGLVISLIGSIYCLKAGTIGELIVGRIIQGAGIGTCLCLVRAISRDVFDGPNLAKIGSVLSMGSSITASTAPIIGGYLVSWLGWHANFAVLLGFSGGLLAITWFFLPETLDRNNVQALGISSIASSYYSLLKNRRFMGYVICTSMASAGIIGYVTISPYITQFLLGLTMKQYSYLAILITAVIFSGRLINVRLLSYFSIEQIMLVGVLTMAAGGILMLIISIIGDLTLLTFVIPMLIFCAGYSLVTSNGMASAMGLIKQHGGTAGALFGGFQLFGCFVLTAMIATVKYQNEQTMAITLVTVALISLASLYYAAFSKAARLEAKS